MKHAVNWFEIPVKNYERAKQFYTTVMNSEITDFHMPEQNMKYGMFAHDRDNNGVGGGLIEAEGQNPSADGCILYLNGGEDLSIPLGKIESAGGKILIQKTDIGEHGFMAQFLDTEGNRMALHSFM